MFLICVQDLQYLSDGLEGRSKNPISLLFDTLVQPNADIGASSPSSLNWTQEPCKAISHVVLGKGRPGGSWHAMQPEVQSLSTGRWLQLPIYQYEDWQEEFGGDQNTANTRVSLGSVAKYYEHYVKKMGIEKNFINGVTVTQVCVLNPRTQYRSQSCESTFSSSSVCSSEQGCTRCSLSPEHTQSRSPEPTYIGEVGYDEPTETQTPVDVSKEDILSDPESEPCKGATVCDSDDTGISCCAKHVCLLPNRPCWIIRGRKIDENGCEVVVSVCAKNLVLATGVNDIPKKLNIPGENLDYVQHAFSKISPNNTAPILVVGAGLSAADAILHALSNRLPVIHAFHQDTSDHKLIYHNMDPKMYSEYVRLFQLMCGKCSDPHYTPLPQHTVEKFSPQRVCTLKNNKENYTRDITISQAFVLIGGQANLEFLPECMSHQLGVKPHQPIEPKKNPIYLDAYTFEAEQFPSLYAIGPLAGDNFVRFVLGGALGITKHLREKLDK